jgi:uncharacterized coiled-coil protein SlyX
MKKGRGKRKQEKDDSNDLELTFEKVKIMFQEMSKRLDSLEHAICFQYSKSRENSTINADSTESLQLESMCAPLFAVTPNPTTVELNRLVRENQLKFKTDQKELKALARKWFRLKRQEAGRKLASIYQKEIIPILTQSNTIEQICERIRSKDELFCRIRELSHLNFSNQDAFAEFICEKFMSIQKCSID